MFDVQLEKRVIKYVSSCPLKHQNQLKSKILSLKIDQYPFDHKQLKNFEPYLKVDQGEYKIIYKLENNISYCLLLRYILEYGVDGAPNITDIEFHELHRIIYNLEWNRQ